MAEFVQQSIEQMLPELEEMVRIKLFTQPETRAVLKKRKAFEYRLRRRTKEREDFIQYIQYEVNVLTLVRERRNRLDIQHKKTEIDLAIVNRIHTLFRMACHRFQHDVNLWLSHIDFAKNRGEKSTTSRLMLRMLQVHNRKPDLWILAAKYEFEVINSIENARTLFQRGLRFNPNSQLLWLEYYRLELLNVDKLKKRREILGVDDIEAEDTVEQKDAVIKGKLADIVFKNAVGTFPEDAKFCLSFLPICSLFNFTENMQKEMLDQLSVCFARNEDYWDMVASREGGKFLKEKMCGLRAVVDLECRKSEILEKACSDLRTEKMWTLLIQYWLQRVGKKSSSELRKIRVEKCMQIFTEAEELGLLSREMKIERIKLFRSLGEREEAKKYCEAATNEYSHDAGIWTLRLQCLVEDDVEEDYFVDLFKRALKYMSNDEDWLHAWELVVNWLNEKNSPHLKSVFESGLMSTQSFIVLFVKSRYLDYTANSEGLKSARKLFARMSVMPPLDKAIFEQYIRMESAETKPEVEKIRQAFDQCLHWFGENDVDIWLKYIQFERDLRKSSQSLSVRDTLRESEIHWKAMRTLNDELSVQFTENYALISLGKGHLIST